MNNREEGLKKLQQRIQESVRQREKSRQVREHTERKEKTSRQQAKEVHAAWLEKHRPKVTKAARTVWRWCGQFIASREFKEFQGVFRRSAKTMRISDIKECSAPAWEFLGNWSWKQLLSIDISGNLYVHNCVKYGKSFPINKEGDLLIYVNWMILIQIAQTITDETIWDIVTIS